MKTKIKIRNLDAIVVEKEIRVSGKDHFQAQLKFPATKTKNKKVYCRKKKHKNKFDNERY